MNKYIIHVTSADNLGLAFLQDVVAVANLGATLQPGTLPSLRFPQIASFVLEAEQPPFTKASVRVFDYDTKQEVVHMPLAVAATFSMEEEEVISPSEESVVEPESDEDETDTADTVTPEGFVALDKEALDKLVFETEFRAEVAKVGVKGRSRDKMTKEYLAKTAK